MGSSSKASKCSGFIQSHTEQLAKWISQVRSKKIRCRSNRKRDLRVEAVLANALYKAEYELRSKQLSRISKWRRMKRSLTENMNGRSYDDVTSGRHSKEGKENNPSADDLLCPELNSLDLFMSQLKDIKIPLQR